MYMLVHFWTVEEMKMTIANAIKKLERNGWTVDHTGRHYIGRKTGRKYQISFLPNGQDTPETSVVCLNVCHVNDKDDFQTDYFAGHYVDSMACALRYAESW